MSAALRRRLAGRQRMALGMAWAARRRCAQGDSAEAQERDRAKLSMNFGPSEHADPAEHHTRIKRHPPSVLQAGRVAYVFRAATA